MTRPERGSIGPLYQRGALPRAVKACVWRMTYGKCWYCGANLNPFDNLVIEHVIPLTRGGVDDVRNLVPSCNYCNQSKGAKLTEEWRPIFADAQGLGRDPSQWLFWFEQAPDSPSWSDGYRAYDRQEWRDKTISFAASYRAGD